MSFLADIVRVRSSVPGGILQNIDSDHNDETDASLTLVPAAQTKVARNPRLTDKAPEHVEDAVAFQQLHSDKGRLQGFRRVRPIP